MLSLRVLLAVSLINWGAPALAQKLDHPAVGSTLRKLILEAVRSEVEPQLEPGIEFVVTYIGVENGWGFVQAEPQKKGGGKLNGRNYFPSDWRKMDGLTVTAVLRDIEGRWTVMESQIGATDAWFCSSTPVAVVAPCGVRERLIDERVRAREARARKYQQLCEDTKYYTREERINTLGYLGATNQLSESDALEAAEVCEEVYPKPKPSAPMSARM